MSCLEAQLKILPANQSVILAREPGGSAARPNALFGQDLPGAGGALKRVTILTARPDTTVLVQADYFPPNDNGEPAASSALPVLADNSRHALTVAAANSRSPSGPTTFSSYLNPIDLYTRTQRGFDANPKAALLDVLA
jgi:hypothetical protein